MEWTFTPPDYLEEAIEIQESDYTVRIDQGKAEATVNAESFDANPALRQGLHDELNDRLLAAQLITHRPYTLSKSTMTRLSKDGTRIAFLEAQTITGRASIAPPDMILTDKEGNVIKDTKHDRIQKKKSLAERIQQHRSDDALLDAVLKSYQWAVDDPDNELIYLFEIRDAFSMKFGGEKSTRAKLGITASEWSDLGQLANDEPLLQGRHRGRKVGELRDATNEELQQARTIAFKMIEAYLALL